MAEKLRRLTAGAARRVALEAQGFNDPRPSGRVTAGHLRRVLRRVGLLQLDSVNVLERSHYLPVFSRLGPYPRKLLDEYSYKRRELFEYWAHAASLIPSEHYPLFRHRMEAMSGWQVNDLARERPGFVESVLAEVRARGPIRVGELTEAESGEGGWWGWGPGKVALEYLFARGLIATSARNGFTRMYDVAERVIRPEYLSAAAPAVEDAQRELVLMASRSLGVGTAKDIADYYRLPVNSVREMLRRLVKEGALEEVEVKGWKEAGYLHPGIKIRRWVNARALLSPFDSLVWERDRTERLFGFRYRIEIYTPEPKRVYGYYVLPFLLGDALVGRVDLKADRQGRRLLVRASHVEAGVDPALVAGPLSEELASMAGWLGLGEVVVEARGGLAGALRKAVG